MEVYWDTDVDLDVHFVRQGGLPFMAGNDCHFEAPTLDWNTADDETDDPFLDNDLTTGGGAETISMADTAGGTYEVYVFLNRHPLPLPPTPTTVTIHLRGQPDAVRNRTLASCGTMWHVGNVIAGTNPPRFDVVDTESSDYVPFADCN